MLNALACVCMCVWVFLTLNCLAFCQKIKAEKVTEQSLMISFMISFVSLQLTRIETETFAAFPLQNTFSCSSIDFAPEIAQQAVKIPSIIKNPGSKKMAGSGDIMIQLFSCCMQQQPSPTRRRHQRLRIDRSMIGNPTNFVHTGLKAFIESLNCDGKTYLTLLQATLDPTMLSYHHNT